MKRTDMWFVTFEDASPVNNLDGKTINMENLCLTMNACDRIIVKVRVVWLPIWVTNNDIHRIFEKHFERY